MTGLAPIEPRLRRSAIVAALLGAFVLGSAHDAALAVVPLLVAAGALCVLGLMRRTAPTIAWLGAVVAAFASAAVPIAAARDADPGVLSIPGWLGVAAPAGVGAVLTLWIATEFATRPERPVAPVAGALARVLLGWLAAAVVVTWIAAATGQRSDPAFTWVDVATYPIAWYVPIVAFVTALGLAGELGWARTRALERMPAAAAATGAGRAWALAAATVDELIPGRSAAATASVAAERRQIAGDLHASVVPSLRRAIEAAEGGGDAGTVLRHLRAADLELERLMDDRWPIVLETFGLVAALEDLAERLEADGNPPITIEIEESEGRPPRDVERTAWRFAQVTLDNAIRHGRPTSIAVRLKVAPGKIDVRVADDGAGFEPSAAHRVGGRGLADVERQAELVGGQVRVESAPGAGTTAALGWRRRGEG
ncbi:MAG TPA: ATP-binding protein [Candidatus Limnocylindrales bacterium]|nr:ATP-binding protein [Candidatus Limnocylindrales bacterium]